MKELFTMWRNTRMVMLVALTAAIYAAILIPFKGFVLIPMFTEVRPANVIPVVFSLLFGPAAAWGSAIGNLIGDFFGGTFGPGSAFGFVGNFLFGLVPYALWGRLGPLSSGGEPDGRGTRKLIEFWVICLLASIACAAFIAWGLEILGLFPFSVLGNIITVNNFLASAILGPFLLLALYPRVRNWGLLWTDVMDVTESRSGGKAVTAALVLSVALLGAFIVGNYISISGGAAIGAAGFAQGDLAGGGGVVYGLSPFWAAVLIALFLL